MTATSITPSGVDGYPEEDDRRARILRAAEGLIAVRGIEKIRLRDIAVGAGVSVGIIQHYFETRDSVVKEMLGWASQRSANEWARAADGVDEPVDQLVSLLEHATADRQRCIVWLATTAAASRNDMYMPDVERTYGTWRTKLTEVITRGVENETFTVGLPIDEVVDGIICVIDGLITAVAMGLPKYQAERNNKLLRSISGLMLGVRLMPSH